MTQKYRQNLGRWGEQVAEKFLIEKGFSIIGKNIRTPYGEIDILSQEGEMLVFVEVKTRTTAQFGFPESGITHTKQIHMLNAAEAFLQANPDRDGVWRLDVIAIRKLAGELPPEIVHFENVLF